MSHGNCLKIALIRANKSQIELAAEVDVKRQQVGVWCRSARFSESVMKKVLAVFDMKESEFVALGE